VRWALDSRSAVIQKRPAGTRGAIRSEPIAGYLTNIVSMQSPAEFLLALGLILLIGLASDYLGRRTFLPRVTLLLAAGILVGEQALGLIPSALSSRFDLVANMALLMIGFLLGGQLTLSSLRRMGRVLIWVSLCAAFASAGFVALVLGLLGLPLDIAVLLGCIAAATAPAATMDTVIETGADTPFARLLMAIVAIDDLWALSLFSFGLAFALLFNGTGGIEATVLHIAWDIGGAIFLGIAIGLPAAYLTGRIRPGQPMLTEALGLVFTCGGAALWLEVSFLVAAISMGTVIANLASHHEYPFHEIENIEWPFMAVFFMLAGASLRIETLMGLGTVGLAYLLARALGKITGAWVGARIAGASHEVKCWMGVALLPQAGVAIGMALLANQRFPQHAELILPLVVATTVVFELFGPVFTRLALRTVGCPGHRA
jgi:Kef-type K+ transport system membrane component KefB